MRYKYITTLDELNETLMHSEVDGYVFSKLDFSAVADKALKVGFRNCVFAGCHIPESLKEVVDDDNLILPRLRIPYRIPSHLYSASDLYDTFRIGRPDSYRKCFDARVYEHYLRKGKELTSDTALKDSFGRVLHDYAISNLVADFLSGCDEFDVVGVMGGHGMPRTSGAYRKVVYLSRELTEKGCLMISGGGPGAMEATHLGAWMAGRSDAEVEEALRMLSGVPLFSDGPWLESAFRVMERFPAGAYRSLGIPTWLYGHEPATPFATHIAKYFDNSIREDSLLTLAKGGIIYTPGSAGTIQEIFQDATQNHYLSFGYASPMVFMDREFWTGKMPLYPLLESLMESGMYRHLILSLADSAEEAAASVLSFRESMRKKNVKL